VDETSAAQPAAQHTELIFCRQTSVEPPNTLGDLNGVCVVAKLRQDFLNETGDIVRVRRKSGHGLTALPPRKITAKEVGGRSG
jgi:hypothetical protein